MINSYNLDESSNVGHFQQNTPAFVYIYKYTITSNQWVHYSSVLWDDTDTICIFWKINEKIQNHGFALKLKFSRIDSIKIYEINLTYFYLNHDLFTT